MDPDGSRGISAPGFWESLIPVWGPGRQALHDFGCGNILGGLFNAALAASDVFALGEALKGLQALKAAAATRLAENKLRGDAFRDFVADAIRQGGNIVRTEVNVRTPFGLRRYDLEVRDAAGKLLGYVEAKLGTGRLTPWQAAKDAWVRGGDVFVDIIRGR
jgi:hypothetical protein